MPRKPLFTLPAIEMLTIAVRRATWLLAPAALLFGGCQKHEPQAPFVHHMDTLAQSSYTVSRSAHASGEGHILLAPWGKADTPGRLMLMDGDGHLLWEKASPHTILDFKKWNYDGLTRYTWFEQNPDLYPGSQAGSIVVADASLQEMKRLSILPFGVITDAARNGFDGHDFILLDDDHYIAMAYASQRVHNVPASLGIGAEAYVVCPVIQEVRHGVVVWQWEGTRYPEFYTTSTFGNNYKNQTAAQDYMHLNSMSIDPRDGHLICSFRSLNQIVKINRITGDIMWRLGGSNSDFSLSPEMQFLRQHHATFTDDGNTLLLFDNGELPGRPYSRILEFQLNETTRTITSFKSFDLPEPISRIMGSVQKIGNHYFIGGGSGNYVLEIDYTTGEKILELKSTAAVPTYRAYKF
jgi:hypothetical protein